MKYRIDPGTFAGLLVILAVAIAVLLLVLGMRVHAAAWDYNDPTIRQWFQEGVVKSCCSNADAYEADFFERGDQPGSVIATVTDGESKSCWESYNAVDDVSETICRRPIPNGSKYLVPAQQMRDRPRNPTGHGILFVNPNNNAVYCYWLPETA